MARKMKKAATSASFSLNRIYRRLSTARPSTMIVSIAAIVIAIFFFGGGLYDLIVQPYPAVYYGGSFLFLYPGISDQFVSDSIVSMMLFGLGTVGLISIYQSTKYAYKPRQAYLMFLIGLIFVLLAYVLLEVTIHLKISGTT
jgi:hypothetical protein